MTPAPSPKDLEPLLAPLEAVQQLLERFGNRGLIIGGVAASLLGQPRLTAAEALEMPEIWSDIAPWLRP